MSLIKRNQQQSPFSFPSLNDFFNREPFNWGITGLLHPETTIPSINIQETTDSYEVEVAAPGLRKEDFDIEINGNVLTISSQKEQSEEKKEDNYTRKEFSYQSFCRSFELPMDSVDEDKVRADYKEGILHLVIPKKEEAKRKAVKKISIS